VKKATDIGVIPIQAKKSVAKDTFDDVLSLSLNVLKLSYLVNQAL